MLPFNLLLSNYLFITYIVTSKPKRISVAAGVVHIINLLTCLINKHLACLSIHNTLTTKINTIAHHELSISKIMTISY